MSAGRRWPSGIGPRLLAFNALLVFLPAAGVLFLDTYERQLLADQERSMVEQGRVLAAALSGRGALREDDARHTLGQLRQRTGARIRVVDGGGRVLADTSRLGPRREPEDATETGAAAAGASTSWLYRLGSLPVRVWRTLRPPSPPTAAPTSTPAAAPCWAARCAPRWPAATARPRASRRVDSAR